MSMRVPKSIISILYNNLCTLLLADAIPLQILSHLKPGRKGFVQTDLSLIEGIGKEMGQHVVIRIL